MKISFKFIILPILLLSISNTVAQKDSLKYEQYRKTVLIEVQNDSLPSYIISIKENLPDVGL